MPWDVNVYAMILKININYILSNLTAVSAAFPFDHMSIEAVHLMKIFYVISDWCEWSVRKKN